MPMQLADGPACPKCDCNDSTAGEKSDRWGRAYQKRRCNFCGWVWSAKMSGVAGSRPVRKIQTRPEPRASERRDSPDAAVYWVAVPPACPSCGGQTRVTSSPRPIRHHECLHCGETFKSIERSPADGTTHTR